MKRKNYLRFALLTMFSIAAIILGNLVRNDNLITAGYILIALTQISYVITFFRIIKKDNDEINSLLTK
jgi:hypothetical protein